VCDPRGRRSRDGGPRSMIERRRPHMRFSASGGVSRGDHPVGHSLPGPNERMPWTGRPRRRPRHGGRQAPVVTSRTIPLGRVVFRGHDLHWPSDWLHHRWWQGTISPSSGRISESMTAPGVPPALGYQAVRLKSGTNPENQCEGPAARQIHSRRLPVRYVHPCFGSKGDR
jgi:hypothetical protein